MRRLSHLIDIARSIVLLVFILSVTISYHPTIVDMSRNAGYESGTILSRYIMLIYVALFVLNFSFSSFKSSFVKHYAVMLIPIFVVLLLVQAIYDNGTMIPVFRDIVLCFLAVVIGWGLNLRGRTLENVLLFFSLLVLFVGFRQVLTNIGGFVIKNQYLADAKNSLGVLLASSVLSLLFIWRSTDRPFIHFASFFALLFGIIIILTIRARAALLAAFLIGTIIFVKSTRWKTVWVVLLIVVLALFVLLPFSPDALFDYVYGSLFAGVQSEDVSSGRFSAYLYALDYLFEENHLWFGDVQQMNDFSSWIHNYPLLQVYSFGLVFSFPILVLYTFLFLNSARHTLSISSPLHESGFALVFLLIIISLLEPTFPFSPGTATLFNYLILGSTLRNLDSRQI